MLTLNLGGEGEKKIAEQLASYDAAGDRAIWEALDLPDPADEAALRGAFPNANLPVIAHYLKVLPGALHNAHANRSVQDRKLVQLLNKLKHGFVAVDDPSAWPGAPQETVGPEGTEPPSPLTATVLTTGEEPGTVALWGIRVYEIAVETYVRTVAAYAGAAEIIAVLCREVPAPGAAAGPSTGA